MLFLRCRAKQNYTWGNLLKDYYRFLENKRLRFVAFTGLKAVSDFIPFVIAYMLGSVIDFFTTYKKGDFLTEFYVLVVGMAFLGGFQVWLRYFAKIKTQEIAAKLREDLRINAMSHLMDLDLRWHEKEDTGNKLEKINQGSENVYNGVQEFLDRGLPILTSILGSLVLFLMMDSMYAIFSLAYFAVYLLGELYFNKKVAYWETKLSRSKEKLAGKFYESTSNLLTVKSLGLKEVFKMRMKQYENEFYKIWENAKEIGHKKAKTIKIFATVGQASFVFLLGYDVVNGGISVGSIIVFYTYFGRLRSALDDVTNYATRFIKLKTSIGRFMMLFREETRDEANGVLIPDDWETIEFKNVNFKYKDKKVMKNFNFKLHRGEKVGIVGTSGTGKSTLAKLLLGLYQPDKGEILMADMPISNYKHCSVTEKISIVLQDSEMFNMSLLHNVIIYSAKKNKLIFGNAVKIANLETVIKKLPRGIHTLIGEKGYKLSGGERQRVGLARALYKNSEVLILDEATSHLDSETEKRIQERLENYLHNRTLIVIAHRLSTLKNVDRIIVIDKGRVVEEGTFDDLVRSKGKFYELYKLQKNKS